MFWTVSEYLGLLPVLCTTKFQESVNGNIRKPVKPLRKHEGSDMFPLADTTFTRVSVAAFSAESYHFFYVSVKFPSKETRVSVGVNA